MYKALFEVLQPFTKYKVIFGGNSLVADYNQGACIITLLRQHSLTKSNRDYKKFTGDLIKQSSLQQLDFQCDVMRVNPPNIAEIEAYSEALRIKEFLKGYDISEALRKVECEILPLPSDIQFLNEFNDAKQLINRATFEFSIVSESKIEQKADKITAAKAEINILQGG